MPFQAQNLGNGQWRVTLSDGRTATVTAKTQPTEEEILGHAAPSETATKPPQDAGGPYGTGWNPLNIASSIKDELVSGAHSAMETAKDPANWPAILGMLGGAAGGGIASRFNMSMLPSVATIAGMAGLGGGGGEAVRQVAEGEDINLPDIAKQAGIQAAWEGATSGVSKGAKRGGSAAYASGAGLARPGYSQNFPTAAQEGLEGGRMSLPIITARGARRAYNRAAPMQGQAIEKAMNAGVQGPSAYEIVRRGYPNMLGEIRSGSDLPKDETKAALDYANEFIKQHSNYSPAKTVQVNTGAVNAQGQPITQSRTIPAFMQPYPIPLDETNELKQGIQSRAKESMKAVNNDKLPGVSGRAKRAVAIGAQKTLEDRVPSLKDINRKIQGLTGLNQSLNPSFRSPQELIDMGVDPEVAQTMTSNATSSVGQRVFGDLLAASLGGGVALAGTGDIFKSIPAFLGGAALFHIGASPSARKVIGAGAYTGGRMLPNAVRAARFGNMMSEEVPALPSEALDPQIKALELAIKNGKR